MHKITQQDKINLLKFLGEYCPTCSLEEQRSFDTPQDVFDLKDRLVEDGLWNKFYNFSHEFWLHNRDCRYDKDDKGDFVKFIGRSSFINWIFRTTDEHGEPHFARLCCEFLEGRK